MKMIELETWERREHFEYFLTMDYPMIDVCAPVDVTSLLRFSKSRGVPFYHASIFAVTTAANRVQNLLYRIRGDRVVMHDRMHPSFTSMDKDTGLFKYVTADMYDDIDDFVMRAREKEKLQKGLFGDGADEARDDLVYLSCLPWVTFTHISHAIKLDRKDSIPRISWGKYYSQGDRVLMPISLQVHHALADGFHIGQFFSELSKYTESL